MSSSQSYNQLLDPMVRFFGFMIFSTIGMGIIALVILAGPITQYYSDHAILTTYRKDIEALEKVCDQHRQLLANLDDPSVMERAAINYLNYVPGDVDPSKVTTLPEPWPALKQALAMVRKDDILPAPTLLQASTRIISENSSYQILLMAFGTALIVVSMTCFCRANPASAVRK